MKTTCRTCNNSGEGDPRDWHHYRHPYVGTYTGPGPTQTDQPVVAVARMPFDPVLRQALIDKGILTIDDIRDAETKVLVVSGELHQVMREAMTDDVPGRTGERGE